MSLPRWAYGDPARIVEAAEIREKNCRVCSNAEFVLGQPLCRNGLRFPACRRDKRGFKLLEEGEL